MNHLFLPVGVHILAAGLSLAAGVVFLLLALAQQKTEPIRPLLWVLAAVSQFLAVFSCIFALFRLSVGGITLPFAVYPSICLLVGTATLLVLLKWQTTAVWQLRARLDDLAERSMQGMAILNQAGGVIRINRRMLEIFGVDPNAPLPAGLTAAGLGLGAAMEASEGARGQAVRLELEHLPGRKLPVTRTGAVDLVVTTQGESSFFGKDSLFVQVDDVTERGHMLDLLREYRCRMELVMQAAEAWSFVCEGSKIHSDGWFRSLGYPFTAVEMLDFSQYIHPQDKRIFPIDRMRMPHSAGDMFSGEIRVRHADGSYVWFFISSRMMEQNGGHVTLGMALNIDRHKRAEQYMAQNDRLTAVGQLVNGVAHDINNHLSTMQMSVKLLGTVTDEVQRQKYLDYVQDAISNSIGILKRLLSFSKGEDDAFSPVEMEELIRQSLEMLERALPREVRLISSVDHGGVVMGSFYELQNVILNIGLNARDAMPPQGGEIAIRGWTGRFNGLMPERDCAWYFISVRDNGSGMSGETQKRVFDPFFTTKPKEKGTGLGMFTSFGCIRRHGGTISVESAEGAGTEFVIALPLAGASAADGQMSAGS